MPAHREVFWNIGSWGNIVYVLSAIALALFIWSVYQRYRLWMLGKPENRFEHFGTRIRSFCGKVLIELLGHKKILREPFAGVMHLIILWAVLSFFILSGADFLDHYFFQFLEGGLYLGFSFVVDILGLLALLAILGLWVRRYIQRPRKLDNEPDDAIVLALLFLLILTGFLVEGHRLAATEMITMPDIAIWSIGGWIFGKIFLGLGETTNVMLHKVMWGVHLAVAIGTVFYISLFFSKLLHVLVAPANIFFRTLRPKGQLVPIDFETADTYGVNNIDDFTWKQLMDLDACTGCGRCQDSCPAHLTGKILSPKGLTQDFKSHMEESWSPFPIPKMRKGEGVQGNPPSLVGEFISQEALWDCTTCGACEAACPVYVEHVGKFIDLRRNQVLSGSEIPQTVQETLRNMEIRGHPWRGAEHLRDDWARGLGIKNLSDDDETDWLYWVGCTGSVIDRNITVTTSLARLLKDAEIDFAILGNDEVCCGDPARRMGQELQFQMMAQQNIDVMKKHKVKKIVTHCPHCFQVLKHEYPQFGGNFEVYHHSELLTRLIGEQKIIPSKEAVDKKVTYHDPCYLGRYNGIFNPPRRILKAIPALRLVEMERNRERSFCCGGGGGHCWMDEPVGNRINQVRMEEARKTGAEVIALACPFCLQMLEDAANSLESSIRCLDLAELLVLASSKL